MLLDELDRLDAENADLVQSRDRFHETDKRCAVLEATVKQGQKDDLSTDLIFTGCMTVSGVGLGFLPSLWPIGAAYFWTGAVVGAVLIGIGIAAKIVKYRR